MDEAEGGGDGDGDEGLAGWGRERGGGGRGCLMGAEQWPQRGAAWAGVFVQPCSCFSDDHCCICPRAPIGSSPNRDLESARDPEMRICDGDLPRALCAGMPGAWSVTVRGIYRPPPRAPRCPPPTASCGHITPIPPSTSSISLSDFLLFLSHHPAMSSFAAVVSRLASLSPMHKDMTDTESITSSQGACSSSLASSSSSDASYNARYSHPDRALTASPVSTDYDNKGELRRNEHLAVLLHKSLWKPDSQASRCDIFLCSRKFSIFERRHHCRKCGGVFCADCSTHATALLDTSNLSFLNPPKGVSIFTYASPESPVLPARVCDECWDQIHGTKSSRSRILQQKKLEEAERWEVDSSSTGSSASSPRTPHTPLDALPPSSPLARMPLRRAHTSPRVHTLSSNASQASSDSSCTTNTTTSSELDAYPLRHASAICKANGGGRWQPKPCVEVIGLKVPGTKAAYEIEMEREEEERRMQRLNPIVKDGEFQLWFPKDVEPRSVAGPFALELSTF